VLSFARGPAISFARAIPRSFADTIAAVSLVAATTLNGAVDFRRPGTPGRGEGLATLAAVGRASIIASGISCPALMARARTAASERRKLS